MGLDGNEKADQLAKEGSISGEHIHIKLSVKEGFSIIKEKIKAKFHARWNEYARAQNIIINIKPPLKLAVYSIQKSLDSIYTRLKLKSSLLPAEQHIADKN